MVRRPTLWMLIGLPGSGKSTWVKQQTADGSENLFIASTDNYIDIVAYTQGKTYDEVFKDTIKDAEKTMYSLVLTAVQKEQDIIWDQTNLNRKSRAKKLIMIPDHYTKIAVYFEKPDDLHERLIHRELAEGKSIPDHVLNNMMNSIEPPEADEGFDNIVVWKDSHGYV